VKASVGDNVGSGQDRAAARTQAPALGTLLLQRDLAVALSTAPDLDKALLHVVEAVLRVDGIDGGGVYLVDAATGDVDLIAHAGLSEGFVSSATHYSADTPSARLLASGQAVYADYGMLSGQMSVDPVRAAEGLRALAVVPVMHGGRVIAALNLGSRTLDDIPDDTRTVIETLAVQIGDAIARVRAEQALREQSRDLQLLFDTLDDFLFVLDGTGVILQVNRVVTERLGYAAEELVGQHVLVVHPESRREEAGAIIAGMLAGEASFCPVPIMTKDGDLIPVETRVCQGTWRGQPSLFGISRDVTQAAEEAKREQDALLTSVLDAVPDLVFLKDARGVYLFCNPQFAAFVGRPREEIIGKAGEELFAPEVAALIRARDEQLFLEMAPQHTEDQLTYHDGRRALFDMFKTPFGVPGEDEPGVLGVGRDLTDRVRAEEEVRALNATLEQRVEDRTRALTAANRELQEFVYSVSHDLRTPLRAVDGFSLAVLDDHGEEIGEGGRSDLQRVRAAAQRMGDLIDALLSLTNVVRAEVQRRETDLSAVAAKVLDDLREAEPERDVRVDIQQGVVADTDPRLSTVVMENLLGNAWKFTAGVDGARIEFADRTAGGRRVFVVRDNGAGFDPAYIDKLFKPFQRLHTAAEFPGTGIGLATVGRVLDRLGGEYWAEGSPGAGASIFFTLP
jgi:PAS domain S-box-containing protein